MGKPESVNSERKGTLKRKKYTLLFAKFQYVIVGEKTHQILNSEKDLECLL